MNLPYSLYYVNKLEQWFSTGAISPPPVIGEGLPRGGEVVLGGSWWGAYLCKNVIHGAT